FRLLQGSPAIDAGHPDVQYNDPDGSTNDMGAYWYVAPPAAPANLSATAGVMQVTLQWDQNTEADFLRYRIYGGTTANPTVKMDSTTNGITDASKVITGLTNGVTYYFRITAVDSSGLESGYSNEVGATPLEPDIPPGVPVNLAATVGDMQVTLRWNQNTEPDFLRYRIYGGTAANPTVKMDSTTDGIADTSKVITGLTNGVTYYFRITAVDSSGLESDYSNEVTVTPVGLVAYYPFNGNANDESGSGYNGTENNGVTLVTDRFGNANSAYSFDGVDDYIDISASSIISFTGDFTTNSWVKVSEADFDFILFGAGSTPTHIMLEPGVDSIKLTYHYTDGFSWYANTSDLSFPKNEWAMVSVVRTGNTIKMYINGAISGTFSGIYAGDAGFNMVGGNSSADPSRYLHGSIDDIAIYNAVLTDTEISQLYANYHAPANFSVSSILGQNTLTWDSTGYQNLEKVSIFKDGTLLTVITVDGPEDTLYLDNTITPGTNYSYYITSLDDFGNTSQPSDTLEVASTPYFSEIDAGLIGLEYSASSWGDYDNDGNTDILLTGWDGTNPISKIYRNNGNSTFTEQTGISLANVHHGYVQWGDYDNDGDLDILLTGSLTEGFTSKIYRNDGGGTFTEQNGISLINVFFGSAQWGDYNNDGYLDILLSGETNGTGLSKVYLNNKGIGFTEQVNISLVAVSQSSAQWGDYDNDGDLDILLSGNDGTNPVTRVYRNDGANAFTEMTGIALANIYWGSVKWGDCDNDGDLDILLDGFDGTNPLALLYRNDGAETFTEITGVSLTGTTEGSVDWGDYDNDGDLDILLTGHTDTALISKIFQNNGGNSFTEQTDIPLDHVFRGSAQFVDYDNDGDLDIFVSGNNVSILISKLYRNNLIIPNIPPSAPVNLTSTPNGSQVTLNWDAATDDKTPSGALTYNIRVGTTPGGFDVISPHALSNGKLTLPGMGNAQLGTDFHLKNLAPSTYYWSVQAIDNGYVGGEWATEQSFTIVGQYTVINEAFTKLMQGESKWADYNNDGYLDLIHTGEDIISEKPMAIIYKNNQDNTFSAQPQILLTGVVYSGVDWGDYNNDGYLDILLNGFDGTQNVSVVYKNNGNNTFNRQDGIELPGVIGSNSQWGDYDNDGSLDILLAGYANTGHIARVYRNNGDQTFTEQTQIELIGLHSGHVSWMDLDADNDLDIVLIGSLNEGFKAIIYRNEGANEFTMMDIPSLSGLNAQQAEWADYDSDGDLDVLILGSNGSDNVTQIYQNLGGFIFSLQNQIEFDGVSEGNAQWFDSDNDGDLDVLINGWNGSEFISFIYENRPDQSFVKQSYFGLAGIQKGSSDVGDFDLDGDLDIFLSGESDMGLIAKIYSNQITKPNTKPDAPKNLNSEIHQSQAILSWESGSDAETSPSSLTYNVRIGTTPGSQNVASPAALTDGKTTFPGFGNAQLGTSFFINNLKIGTYYWSVQAIDNSYEGGTWSEEQSFKIENSTVHFQVIDFDSVGIPNVTYSINPGNIFSGTSGNNGDIGPHSLPSGIYSLNLNKPGYFNYLNRTIPVLETTFEKKIILPELADYNGDNQVDITDLDSVILNWESMNPVLEMGPATGILPAFTVEPDQQFDFEDLMVFGLLWDYYNNQKVGWQPYSENERDEFQNSEQIVAVLTENFDENALEYSFIWMGSGGFTSNRALVRYNPDLLIANLTLLLSKENQVLSFNNHDVDKGIVQVTFGVLEDAWIQPGTGLFKISFEKKAGTVELPEAYFEYHLGKTIEKGAIQFQEFNQGDLSIFPNPVTKSLTIYCKNAEGIFTVKLFDIAGQLIKAIEQQGNQLNLDMQHFPQGILFLEISYGNVKRNIKVIKQ
ncbi:MAG: FG-GAP-like repeat-containing protein, partial [Salinivirgaceae bacterium]|nr:FG-GAP-like repeat-containing protein [Salinivirgaceae bacterium]